MIGRTPVEVRALVIELVEVKYHLGTLTIAIPQDVAGGMELRALRSWDTTPALPTNDTLLLFMTAHDVAVAALVRVYTVVCSHPGACVRACVWLCVTLCVPALHCSDPVCGSGGDVPGAADTTTLLQDSAAMVVVRQVQPAPPQAALLKSMHWAIPPPPCYGSGHRPVVHVAQRKTCQDD